MAIFIGRKFERLPEGPCGLRALAAGQQAFAQTVPEIAIVWKLARIQLEQGRRPFAIVFAQQLETNTVQDCAIAERPAKSGFHKGQKIVDL